MSKTQGKTFYGTSVWDIDKINLNIFWDFVDNDQMIFWNSAMCTSLI